MTALIDLLWIIVWASTICAIAGSLAWLGGKFCNFIGSRRRRRVNRYV